MWQYVDIKRCFDRFVGELEERSTGDSAGIVNQNINIPNFFLHFFRRLIYFQTIWDIDDISTTLETLLL